MKRCVLAVVGLLASVMVHGQIFNSFKVFQDYRNELSFGVGSTSYLGDLVEPSQTVNRILSDVANVGERMSAHFAHRVFFSRFTAIKSGLYLGNIGGHDNNSSDPTRVNRNLQFKSLLLEGSVVFEIHFLSDETRSLHRMRGVHPKMNIPFGIYAFAGVGGTYFNPKADFLGETYNLREQGTEGQGLGGGVIYPKVAMVTPVGLGFRYRPAFRMYLALELSFRPAFTDYLDDVSGNYFDTNELYANRGEASEYFGDPSLTTADNKFNAAVLPGQPRGDASGLDSYMFAQLSYSYKLYNPSKYHRAKPTRTKWRRYGRDPRSKGKM